MLLGYFVIRDLTTELAFRLGTQMVDRAVVHHLDCFVLRMMPLSSWAILIFTAYLTACIMASYWVLLQPASPALCPMPLQALHMLLVL